MSDDHPIRIERTFWPSGMPKSETHYRGDSCHGPWREWHSNGVLAREWMYDKHVFADGDHRTWFENGQLQSVLTFRDANLIQEIAFNKRGKQVPTALDKYFAAERKFLLRIAERAKLAMPPKRLRSCAPDDAKRHHDFIDQLLATPHRPAHQWLRESGNVHPRSLGEMDAETSIRFIDILHDLGAPEVLAVELESEIGLADTTNHLVIALPTDPAARARLFHFKRAQGRRLGFTSEGDWGQSHLFMMLC